MTYCHISAVFPEGRIGRILSISLIFSYCVFGTWFYQHSEFRNKLTILTNWHICKYLCCWSPRSLVRRKGTKNRVWILGNGGMLGPHWGGFHRGCMEAVCEAVHEQREYLDLESLDTTLATLDVNIENDFFVMLTQEECWDYLLVRHSHFHVRLNKVFHIVMSTERDHDDCCFAIMTCKSTFIFN